MDEPIHIDQEKRAVSRWVKGDTDAARILFDIHRGPIYRLAFSLLDHPEDAEDVAQEALMDALLRPEMYDPSRGQFRTWLHAIVLNRCRQHHRKNKRKKFSILSWFDRATRDLPAEQDSPEESSARAQTARHVRRSIRALSPPLREAIVLRMWGGYSYKEIGQLVGCPERTAQSRVRLAMRELGESIPSSLEPNTQETWR